MSAGGFVSEDVFEINMALRCRIKVLERIVKEFKSGERYKKIQKDHSRVIKGYIKEIKKLKRELGDSRATTISVRNIWMEQIEIREREHGAEMAKKDAAIRRLEDEKWELKQKYNEDTINLRIQHEDELFEKDCIIAELKKKLAHAEALLGHDSTNTSLPTSKTPPGKKKRIPNCREKTDRPKGGQVGHEKHTLQPPDTSEITDYKTHALTTDERDCPECGSFNCVPTGKVDVKYEYDIEVIVKKIAHLFPWYKCLDCGTEFRAADPQNLRGDVQYGPGVQAIILSMTNTVNAAMNKTAMFIKGITNGELTPCEGYIAKLQDRAAKGLIPFREDAKRAVISSRIVYWDDTVISIMKKRGCLRFYGDEMISYYTAHLKKDMAGIDEDNLLALLAKETIVMHDHCSISYNSRFIFLNIECNQHLERDLQKNTDDTQHEWSGESKGLIGRTMKDRKDAIARGEKCFGAEYIKSFHERLDKCLEKGWRENEELGDRYGNEFERALLNRIAKYRENYFLWLEDFTLPTTNNLSERGLRGAKSRLKVSGQFEAEKTAKDYASIITYTGTCRKNEVNEFEALKRLCEGNPYTIDEVLRKAE